MTGLCSNYIKDAQHLHRKTAHYTKARTKQRQACGLPRLFFPLPELFGVRLWPVPVSCVLSGDEAEEPCGTLGLRSACRQPASSNVSHQIGK